MDDALAVDHRLHLLHRQPVQPHGLDDLQSLVHEGGRVDGDLGPHAPVRVLQSVRRGLMLQFLMAQAEKRPAGAGQQQTLYLPAIPAALQALENGRVLRIHRHDLGAAALRLRHHQLAGAHQRLLIGQSDALFLPDSRQRGFQSNAAHDGGDHRVRLRQHRRLQKPLRPLRHPDIRVGQPQPQLSRRRPVIQHRQLRMELSSLLLQQIHLAVGRQRRHRQSQLLHHL